MLQYHGWILVLSMLTQGNANFDLSADIRLGKISTFLIYPFNFLGISHSRFSGLPNFAVALWPFYWESPGYFQYHPLPLCGDSHGGLVVSNVHQCPPVFSAIFIRTCGASGWKKLGSYESLLTIITTFLSGAVIPLDLFPKTLSAILAYSPFPYMVYYPVKVAMGLAPLDLHVFVILTAWALVFAGLNVLVWRRGLRLYTGAGM